MFSISRDDLKSIIHYLNSNGDHPITESRTWDSWNDSESGPCLALEMLWSSLGMWWICLEQWYCDMETNTAEPSRSWLPDMLAEDCFYATGREHVIIVFPSYQVVD